MDNYTDLMLSCPFHGIALDELFSPPNSVYYRCSECDRQVRSALQAIQVGSNAWRCLDDRADEGEGRENEDRLDCNPPITFL